MVRCLFIDPPSPTRQREGESLILWGYDYQSERFYRPTAQVELYLRRDHEQRRGTDCYFSGSSCFVKNIFRVPLKEVQQDRQRLLLWALRR